jgi:hypothetical protein
LDRPARARRRPRPSVSRPSATGDLLCRDQILNRSAAWPASMNWLLHSDSWRRYDFDHRTGLWECQPFVSPGTRSSSISGVRYVRGRVGIGRGGTGS